VVAGALGEGDSLEEEEDPEVVLAKPKISFIEYTSPSKISTREKPQNSPLRGTSSARNARAKVEKTALPRLATVVAVVVSKSLCVRWDL
jgi:hypothetical protein